MSILDIDNDTLDINAARAAWIAQVDNHPDSFWSVVHSDHSKLFLSEDGFLSTQQTMTLRRWHESKHRERLHNLVNEGIVVGLRARIVNTNCEALDGQIIGPTIDCLYTHMSGVTQIRGIKINVYDKLFGAQQEKWRSHPYNVVSLDMSYDSEVIDTFEDTEIHFDDTKHSQINFTHCAPTGFNGLKSNVEHINMYILHDWPEYVEELFEKNYKVYVYDELIKGDAAIGVRGLNKMISLANNSKRYILQSDIIKLKDGAKLSNIFPQESFKNLKGFSIRNNYVSLDFFKGAENCPIPMRLIRTPECKKCKPSEERFLKTEDGFYVCISKR